MNSTDLWLLKQRIKSGQYTYSVGENVVVSHRNNRGYPRKLKDDVLYQIRKIDKEHLHVSVYCDDKKDTNTIKVHKYYMTPKSLLRDIKLEIVFK